MNNEPPEPSNELQEQKTIWNKSFISLFFTNMALNMGMFMTNSILSVYANSLGATESMIGLLMGGFAITSIVFRVISAPLMDTYNRKNIVAAATSILFIAFLGFSIAKSVHMLFVFRLLQGCAMAFGNACCLAMVADMLPKEKYASGIGYYSLAQVICQAAGPFFGLAMVRFFGFAVTFAVTAVVMLVASFLAFQIKTTFKRTKKLEFSLKSIVAKDAILPACMMLLLSAGASSVSYFLILFAGTRGITTNIGLFFTVLAVTMLMSRPVAGKLDDRYGAVKTTVPALFCAIASYYMIGSSSTLFAFLISAVVYALGFGASSITAQALAMKSVTGERRGAASSMYYVGMDLGYLLGAMVCGNIAQSYGYATMWYVTPAFFFIIVLLMIFFRGTIARIEKGFDSGTPGQ